MHFGKLLPLLLIAFCQAAAADSSENLDIRPDEGGAICGATTPQLEVLISGVRAQGILTVELYQPSERDFLRKASRLKRVRVPAQDGTQVVCFDIEKAGQYALAAYHDLDSDRKLARKWNRLPDEPFALSNGQKLELRMPKFEDAAIQAGEEMTRVRLELRR